MPMMRSPRSRAGASHHSGMRREHGVPLWTTTANPAGSPSSWMIEEPVICLPVDGRRRYSARPGRAIDDGLWGCCMEWVGDAVAESKQDHSGQRRGNRTTTPDGVWCSRKEKAANRWADGQGKGEGEAVERQVAAEQVGWSHVSDERPEDEDVCDLPEREDDCDADEEAGRRERRVDERRRQHREQADSKERACQREGVCASHPRHYAHR